MLYYEIEKKLNEGPASISLHDQSVCNLRFYKNNLYIRFVQSYYNDSLGILKDENGLVLLDLVLYDIDILDMYLGNDFNFINSEVLRNTYENGVFYLYLDDFYHDENFCIHLKFKKFKWSVFKVIDKMEYEQYLDDIKNLKLNNIVLSNGKSYDQKPTLSLFNEIEKDKFATWLNEK